MTKKYKLSGIQILYEFEGGGPGTAYGRCDEFETENDFMKAVVEEDDTVEIDELINVKKALVRVNVLSEVDQEITGSKFIVAEVNEKGPGVWESWIVDLPWASEYI